MKNNCLEDRKEMAQEIAEVRKTGLVNMYDAYGVVEALKYLGFDYTAEYIESNKVDYRELLEMSKKY